jgi:cytosine permease
MASNTQETEVVAATRTGALSDDHALQPVPLGERRGLWQMILVQVGWHISVSAFLLGSTVGSGTNFRTGITAIFIGNLVLSALAVLIGIVGFRAGLTSYLISRVVFGVRGSVLVSVVLGIIAMGFIGVLMDAWSAAINRLVPAVPAWAIIIGLAIAITATAITGFKGLARFKSVAVPIEILIALIALVIIATRDGGFTKVLAHNPAAPITLTAALGAAVSTWISGVALVSDVSRYARSIRDVVISSIAGFVGGAGIFEAIASISAMKVGNGNFVLVLEGLGLLLPGVIMLILALWNTADNNLYSSSLAFTNASRILGASIPRAAWVVVAVLIAVVTAFAGFAGQFLKFLTIIGVLAPPFVGIVVSHFWVLGRVRQASERLLATAPVIRWEALIAWVAGSLVGYNTTFFVKALNGLIAGAIVYAVLVLIRERVFRRDAVTTDQVATEGTAA